MKSLVCILDTKVPIRITIIEWGDIDLGTRPCPIDPPIWTGVVKLKHLHAGDILVGQRDAPVEPSSASFQARTDEFATLERWLTVPVFGLIA